MSRNKNLKVRADESNPDWEHNYTQNSDEFPHKGKGDGDEYPYKRFQFHNHPKDQGNLISADPGDKSVYDLAHTLKVLKHGIRTSNNDVFDSYSFSSSHDDAWLALTIFKRSVDRVNAGDIVITYGNTGEDRGIIRRRFGSVPNAYANVDDAVRPIAQIMRQAIILPQAPAPDDSLHEHQGENPGAAGGNYFKDKSELEEKEPHQGYDIGGKVNRQTMMRTPWMFGDEITESQSFGTTLDQRIHSFSHLAGRLKKAAAIAWNPKSLVDAQQTIIENIPEIKPDAIINTKSASELVNLVRIAEEEANEARSVSIDKLENLLAPEGGTYRQGIYLALAPIYPIITNPTVFQNATGEEIKNLVMDRVLSSTILKEEQKDRFARILHRYDIESREGIITLVKFVSNAILQAQGLSVVDTVRGPMSEEKLQEAVDQDKHYAPPKPMKSLDAPGLIEPKQTMPGEFTDDEEDINTTSNIHVKVTGNVEDNAEFQIGVYELGLDNFHGSYATRSGFVITSNLGYPSMDIETARNICTAVRDGQSRIFTTARIGRFSTDAKDPRFNGVYSLYDEVKYMSRTPEELANNLAQLQISLNMRQSVGIPLPPDLEEIIPYVSQAALLADTNRATGDEEAQAEIDGILATMEGIMNDPKYSPLYDPKLPPETQGESLEVSTPEPEVLTPEVPEKPTPEIDAPTETKPKGWMPPESVKDIDKKRRIQEQEARDRRSEQVLNRGQEKAEKTSVIDTKVKEVQRMLMNGFMPREEIEQISQKHPWILNVVDEEQLKDYDFSKKTVQPTDIIPPTKEIKMDPGGQSDVGKQFMDMDYSKEPEKLDRLSPEELDRLFPGAKAPLPKIRPDQWKKMKDSSSDLEGAIKRLSKKPSISLSLNADIPNTADMDKEIPLEIVEQKKIIRKKKKEAFDSSFAEPEPDNKDELIKNLSAAVYDQAIKQMPEALNRVLDHPNTQNMPRERVNMIAATNLISTILLTEFDNLMNLGLDIHHVSRMISRIAANFATDQQLKIDQPHIEQVMTERYSQSPQADTGIPPISEKPETRQPVNPMPTNDAAERQYTEQYTSDEIWQHVQDPSNPNYEMAKSLIERGVIAKKMAIEKLAYDMIPGGKADTMPSANFDPIQLQKGIQIEMEHTTDPFMAEEIAKDHLTEIPDYYDRLTKMEEEANGAVT